MKILKNNNIKYIIIIIKIFNNSKDNNINISINKSIY